MHALLITVLLAVGADRPDLRPAPDNQVDVYPDPQPRAGERDPYVDEGVIGSWFHNAFDSSRPMPQTCYSPHFGCYPGNGRDIQRYPAFHGTYYRRAYNYRQLFEYPWQAEAHEPRALMSTYVQMQESLPAPRGRQAGDRGIPLPPPPPRPLDTTKSGGPGMATASQTSYSSRMMNQ